MVEILAADLQANGVNQGDLIKNLENTRDLVNALQTLFTSNTLWAPPVLIEGSTPTAVANSAFNYAIDGRLYPKPAVAAGTAPGNDVIPDGTFGAVAFDIGVNGTIDVIEAGDNASGYTTAALAVAGLAAVASGHVRMGTVTAMQSGANFTFGTSELSSGTTVAFTDGTPGIDGLETTPLTLLAGSIL